jgi:multidrug resistance efflux pump
MIGSRLLIRQQKNDKESMKRRRAIAWGFAVVIFAAVIGVVAATRTTSPASDDVLVVPVRKGNLDLKVYATGEVQANHSMMLIAPAVGGGALQITRLLHTGVPVKKGDIVFEFDPSEQEYKLEQSRSEFAQAEQEIAKASADASVQTAEDKVAMLKARFDLRRAELEVQKNELVSTIDAQKNNLGLEQAKNALTQLQQDIESHKATGQATVVLAQEKKNKAKLAMDQAQQNIEKMHVTASMDGLISIQRNPNALGGMMWQGMSMPSYRAGDQVQAGSAIAQVIDATQMEVMSKIAEQNRSNLKAGQIADVVFDALPGEVFRGAVKTVGGMSRTEYWEANTVGKFEVSIVLDKEDPRLRPGLTAQITILGDEKKDVLYVPKLALFMRDSKRIVYVKNSRGFQQREVKIDGENESRAAIEGLSVNDKVALLDPTAPKKPGSETATGAGGVTP